ncbi:hypothetical protein VF21_08560 [Pseudogymnoascus sp. 05NY08]|nr:hypothetical protein VF21_08560 [Pseudogymnoascus sp. 05NY08]
MNASGTDTAQKDLARQDSELRGAADAPDQYEDVAVINAEREEIEAEQNAEEARVEAELAEATRRKKAAIHATRGPEGKENDRFCGGSNAAKSKNKGKKKNKASAFGGGEAVEYLGDI